MWYSMKYPINRIQICRECVRDKPNQIDKGVWHANQSIITPDSKTSILMQSKNKSEFLQ